MKKNWLGAFFLLTAFSAFTQDNPPNESAGAEIQQSYENSVYDKSMENFTVSKITFFGLKKTQNFYMQSKIKKFIGKPFSEKLFHELETAIQVENLFDNIKFNFAQSDDSEMEIEISVVEKITFIPLPFLVYTSDGLSGGGAVLDMNAFGVKDMFAATGFFSKDSRSAFAMFSKTPKDNFIPGFVLGFSASKSTKKIKNLENESDVYILKYKNTEFSGSISFTEKLGEFNSVNLGIGLKRLWAADVKGYEDAVDSIKIGAVTTGWNFSKSDWNGWFLSNTNISAAAYFSITDDSSHKYGQKYTAKISFQKPIFPQLRFLSQTSGIIGKDNHISEYSGRSAASVTIIPDSFVSQRLAGSANGFEFAFFKGKIGIMSVYGMYEVLYAQDFNGKYEFCHGPSGGFKLYLSKVAFPAMSIGLSYNITHKYMQYAIAMGMSI